MAKRFCLIGLLLVIMLTSGCWDIVDISDKAYITSMAIDKAEDTLYESKANIPKRYKVSIEVVNPLLLRQNTGRLKLKEKASFVVTDKGESIEKTLELLQGKVAAPLSLTQLNVVLVGEDMAKQDLNNIISFLEKNPEIARRLRIMFVKGGEAFDILHSNTHLRRYIAEELIGMAEINGRFSLVRNESYNDLVRDFRANKGQGLAARIFVNEDKQIVRHGAAIFDNWKLKGWLSSEETRQANWLIGKGRATLVGKLGAGIYTFQVDKKTLKIKPIVENNKVRFEISLKADGTILQEENSSLDFYKPENISKVEHLFANVIHQEIIDALAKAQKDFQVDYLALGMKLMNKYPKIYEKLDWKKEFSNVPVDVKIRARITRFGVSR